MSSKPKNQHTLPNRQLARAFNFSAQDLSANRAGFMSRAQEWGLRLWFRQVFGWLDTVLPLRLFSPARRRRIFHLCGKARREYVQRQISSPFHTDIQEAHYLFIDDERFLLTAQQYHAVAEGVVYQVYFAPQGKRILSLERAIHGCDEGSS